MRASHDGGDLVGVVARAQELEVAGPDPVAAGEVFAELREPVRMRWRDEVTALFDGFELLDPGVVPAPEWRPDRPYRSPSRNSSAK